MMNQTDFFLWSSHVSDVLCREESGGKKWWGVRCREWQRENNILTDNEHNNIKYRPWGHAWIAILYPIMLESFQYKTSITRLCFTDYSRGMCDICECFCYSKKKHRKDLWSSFVQFSTEQFSFSWENNRFLSPSPSFNPKMTVIIFPRKCLWFLYFGKFLSSKNRVIRAWKKTETHLRGNHLMYVRKNWTEQ